MAGPNVENLLAAWEVSRNVEEGIELIHEAIVKFPAAERLLVLLGLKMITLALRRVHVKCEEAALVIKKRQKENDVIAVS